MAIDFDDWFEEKGIKVTPEQKKDGRWLLRPSYI
jgi:hypothetical protein